MTRPGPRRKEPRLRQDRRHRARPGSKRNASRWSSTYPLDGRLTDARVLARHRATGTLSTDRVPCWQKERLSRRPCRVTRAGCDPGPPLAPSSPIVRSTRRRLAGVRSTNADAATIKAWWKQVALRDIQPTSLRQGRATYGPIAAESRRPGTRNAPSRTWGTSCKTRSRAAAHRIALAAGFMRARSARQSSRAIVASRHHSQGNFPVFT